MVGIYNASIPLTKSEEVSLTGLAFKLGYSSGEAATTGFNALDGVTLTDTSAVYSALTGANLKQHNDFFFFRGVKNSETLVTLVRFDAEGSGSLFQSRDEGQVFLRSTTVNLVSGDKIELKEVDLSYLPVTPTVDPLIAPTFDLKISSLVEDQTDDTGAREAQYLLLNLIQLNLLQKAI